MAIGHVSWQRNNLPVYVSDSVVKLVLFSVVYVFGCLFACLLLERTTRLFDANFIYINVYCDIY